MLENPHQPKVLLVAFSTKFIVFQYFAGYKLV